MSDIRYSFRVLWSSEDEGYIATCPEFDGVSGFGETEPAALAAAQAALQLAVEEYAAAGWTLPQPDTLAEFSGQFRLRLPVSLHQKLSVRAADEGVSLNSYATSILAAGLGAADAQSQMHRQLSEVLFELRSEAANVRLAANSTIVLSNSIVQTTGQWPVVGSGSGGNTWPN